ncbi:type II toxin-antitoxin system RelE/ParE family toxin [Companilactobacillus huachuanensis]|uniref:Type II toxin-antitoxin system RelE/ParE family toxin n=1 Tax=Companilactobacillus huachuanensis TaxID=2559914 RepID=A0ABW1RLH1_9LACO|nr:type II toxin-antitoxin system RelE/ParE family toxin [Companilactobacillus huachuanensis]
MSYKLQFTHDAQKSLRKMDMHQAELIVRWLYQSIDGIDGIDGIDDSRTIDKGLTANRSGHWRYRIGNYRIIVEISMPIICSLVGSFFRLLGLVNVNLR